MPFISAAEHPALGIGQSAYEITSQPDGTGWCAWVDETPPGATVITEEAFIAQRTKNLEATAQAHRDEKQDEAADEIDARLVAEVGAPVTTTLIAQSVDGELARMRAAEAAPLPGVVTGFTIAYTDPDDEARERATMEAQLLRSAAAVSAAMPEERLTALIEAAVNARIGKAQGV